MSFENLLKEKKTAFEAVLYTYFSQPSTFETKIFEAMAYSLSAGGKRLRPLLLLEAYKLCCRANDHPEDHASGRQYGHASGKQAMTFAVAMEMIHTYSLIHDDLPAMDNDDFRRGKPTNHKVFGEAMAVLAGDGLLNQAYELMLSEALTGSSQGCCISAAAAIAKAAGVKGMIGGQVVDMLCEGQAPNAENLSFIHQHKTADLLIASLVAGALLAQGTPAQVEALRLYGHHIGMAFQIIDDILDITGNQETLGKDIGSDEGKGKLTYPAVYGLAVSKGMAKKHLEEALVTLAIFPEASPFLLGLADFLLNRDH